MGHTQPIMTLLIGGEISINTKKRACEFLNFNKCSSIKGGDC